MKQIVLKLHRQAHAGKLPLVANHGPAHAFDPGVTPAFHSGNIFLRQAHQLGKHVQRKGLGKLADKLDCSALQASINQTVGDLL